MILDRFPALRSFKLIAWVALAVGWVTAIFARVAMAPAELPVVPEQAPTVVMTEADAIPGIPALPANGLVVIRHTPAERPTVTAEPIVRTVTVTRVVQAPPATTSSGS
ncbi:hypothetical protein HQ535_06050 [bacterium]|nr:hypothetical protein [bacterium]